MALLGKSLPHDSAREHVTGEAVYLDDRVPHCNELQVDFVGSPLAHGRIKKIDVTAAREVPGIVAVYTHADVPGEKTFGMVFHDEELLASAECQHLGQPVVVLAGTSREALRIARRLVRLELEELPAVLGIEEALAKKQFIGPKRRIKRGDVEMAFAHAEHMLEGSLTSGGQEHFYLEPQSALVMPGEGGQLTIHSSTQNPTEIQAMTSRCLGLRQNQVICECRRMGGGFGGKESQGAHPALLAALVALKTRRPARLVLTCDQDMQFTGKRHPYLSRYRVSFTRDGHITGLQIEFFSNGGFSADLSLAVMERTLLHAENAYYIPHVDFSGAVCRTNLPSNTAFRGFGGPQAVAVIENVIEEIAVFLGLDAYDVRRRNCYGEDGSDITPYGQRFTGNNLTLLLERLAESANYKERLAAVRNFNGGGHVVQEQADGSFARKVPGTYLKGISLVPVKFGISFTRTTLNQASALVNLYLDGTIQVSTGGTEMGQGLNTKIRQLVADQFDLPAEAVAVLPTSTDKNNNTSPTAASASTDLNGAAAVRACEVLRQRLAEVAARRLAGKGMEPSGEQVRFEGGEVFDVRSPDVRLSFQQLVRLAHEERVNLGERGFFATPDISFDWEIGSGNPFRYYTCGCAVAEVLIDRHTGDLRVPRVDILMDLGQPINPAIELGQITGGFVQGMGWVTTEALRYSSTGELLSHSPTTYKVPNVTDVPAEFNIAFLEPSDNPLNVYGSKAVGEPPLLLGVAVWTAIKHALSFVSGGKVPRLDLPATNEEILCRLAELEEVQEAETGAMPTPQTLAVTTDSSAEGGVGMAPTTPASFTEPAAELLHE